jgi:Arsenite-resistance protein 2
MELFINPLEADVLKLGGIDIEETLKKEIDGAITREAEDRWRCGVKKCKKLFLEEKFVRSHIQKRHKEWLDKVSIEVIFPFQFKSN